MIMFVVLAAGLRRNLAPVFLAPLGFEIAPGRFVGGKNGGGRPKLGAHIGDHMSIHRVESAQSRPVIFDDPPNAAGDAATSQKLQDDIFGADPWRQLARELYA